MWRTRGLIAAAAVATVVTVAAASPTPDPDAGAADGTVGLLVSAGTPDAALQTGAVCTGTVLGDRVLTAAHCVDTGHDLEVVVAPASLCGGGPYTRRTVTVVATHPPAGGARIDLAVLTIATTGGQVPPHAMPRGAGATFTAHGWGGFTTAGIRSCHRHTVALEPVPDCPGTLTATGRGAWELCAVGRDGNTCAGDSGGPVTDRSGLVVAVTSAGVGCDPADAGLYMRLAPSRDWLALHGVRLTAATPHR